MLATMFAYHFLNKIIGARKNETNNASDNII